MAKVTVEFEVEGPQIMIVGGDMTNLERVTVVPFDPDKAVDIPRPFAVGDIDSRVAELVENSSGCGIGPVPFHITIHGVKDAREFIPKLERELKRQGMNLGR